MGTATRYVLLMHPKEFRREKANTGRLTHLCLSNSEIIQGVAFDDHPRVKAVLADPSKHVVLLYPGDEAVNLSLSPTSPVTPPGKELVVLLLDATWSCARKMLKMSPSLQRLPRIMFTPSTPSRYVIKQQPFNGCLSTLESVHEVLTALAARGEDRYELPRQLLEIFDRMQQFQIKCAVDPNLGGYRRQPYKPAGERKPFTGKSSRRRANLFRFGDQPEAEASD